MAFIGKLAAMLNKFRGTMIAEMGPATFDLVWLDATTRRTHSDPGVVAGFPVEFGIDGADNFHKQPNALVVEGVFTDTPIQFLAGINTPQNRAVELYNKLLSFQEREVLLYVFTDIRVHPDMVLESIDVDEDAETGDCIPVTLSFRKSPILTEALVPAALDFDAFIAGGGGTADLGTQSTVAPFDYVGPAAVP